MKIFTQKSLAEIHATVTPEELLEQSVTDLEIADMEKEQRIAKLEELITETEA